jgi:hypothetical protein
MATFEGPPGSGSETNTASGPSARLRPARAWYWVALGVVFVGVAWAALMFAVLIRRVDSFQRVPDPGSGMISLTHSGGYLIYYEGPGASSGNVPPFNVNVTPASGSAAVQSIESYSGSLTYQFGHHEGTAVLTLRIAHPGSFLVTATSSTAPPGSHLAIGSSIAGGIALIVIPAVLLVLAGIGGAITIAIIRHSRAKRARQPQPPAGYWQPQEPPVPQQQPPQPRKTHTTRNVVLICAGAAVVVLVAAGIVASVTGTGKKTAANSPTTIETSAISSLTTTVPEAPSTEDTSTPAAPQALALGAAADITWEDGAAKVTVLKVRRTTIEYSTPTHGRYVEAFVRYRVVSGSLDVSTLDWAALARNHHAYDSTFGGVTNELDSTTVRAGAFADGWVVFDVGTSPIVEIQYAPNYGGDILCYWRVHI